ncbi:SET domain-containing protein [Mycena filopes]|nr:SET domain-containing protein [Mycena filopes]
MRLDADNAVYVLNRAISNLRLTNWQDAESDATQALKLSGNDAEAAQKALFRRARARKALGDDTGARTDLKAYVARGGQQKLADAEALLGPLATAEPKATATLVPVADTKPLFVLRESNGLNEITRDVHSAAERLSASALLQLLSLHSSYGGDILVSTYRTNALPDGLCIVASRFNHSCLPNARYSFHTPTKSIRIFALTDIAPGEELRVSYLASRNVYGSTRAERQRRFLASFNFVCVCPACSLTGAALEASDARRREAAALWNGLTAHDPRLHGGRVVRDAVRGIRLLREEGYMADADDFARDAAAFCAMHSDWESAKYWAKLDYDTKCAEFGKDHEHARKAKVFCDDPRRYAQAGMYSGQKFPARV